MKISLLQTIATLLAFASAFIHLLLSMVNLILGENTVGPVFAVMAIGYVIGAAMIRAGRPLFLRLVTLYTIILIVAYAGSRESLPIEPIGLATKIVEISLLITLWRLMRKPSA